MSREVNPQPTRRSSRTAPQDELRSCDLARRSEKIGATNQEQGALGPPAVGKPWFEDLSFQAQYASEEGERGIKRHVGVRVGASKGSLTVILLLLALGYGVITHQNDIVSGVLNIMGHINK